MYAFFIVRGLRRHGVGLQAARELLRLIPGVWGIAFQNENACAAVLGGCRYRPGR